ncbi:hypothetical protein [Anaerosporobacter sp.]
MKKTKKIVTFSCLCICCVAGYFFLNNSQHNDTKQTPDTGIDISSLTTNQEEGTQLQVSASYADSYDNFDELIANADLIVKGTVENVTQKNELAVSVTFRIDERLEGASEDTIEIMQLVSDHLTLGESYLLTLKPSYIENSYYIMGGYQGAFIDDNQSYTALDPNFQEDVDLSVNDELSNGEELLQVLDEIINE